jgi:hypothetical protein
MNVADMMGALRRRWYVLVAGLIVAGLAAYGVWAMVKVEYTRTATQLMLPGPGTIPEDANPFLFVGGLSQAADVLVRKMGSPDVLAEVEDEFPNVDIVITRDPLSSGPVLLTSVTSQSDADAAAVVDGLVTLTESTLLDIQRVEGIPATDRITLVTLTIDNKGTVEQKSRLIAAGATGVGAVALTLLLIALIDGLARARAQRRGRPGNSAQTKRTPNDREDGGDDADMEDMGDPDDLTESEEIERRADVEDRMKIDGPVEVEDAEEFDEEKTAGTAIVAAGNS